MGTRPLVFAEFATAALRALEREGMAQPSTSLSRDLMLDSLELLELTIVMGELEAEVPEDLFEQIDTLGELYNFYVLSVSGGRST